MNSFSHEELIADLKQRGLYRQLRTIDLVTGTRVCRAGRSLVNFASNDYLGLTQHPKLKLAALTVNCGLCAAVLVPLKVTRFVLPLDELLPIVI